MKGPAVGSPTSEESIQQLVAVTPPVFRGIARELHGLALEVPGARSLPCIFLPEVNVSLKDREAI